MKKPLTAAEEKRALAQLKREAKDESWKLMEYGPGRSAARDRQLDAELDLAISDEDALDTIRMRHQRLRVNARDLLRFVALGDTGYTLSTWSIGPRGDRWRLGYRFEAPGGKLLFQGDDFEVPAHAVIDSDDTLRSLLTFLTLRPGDTGRDYFDGYNAKQRAFAEGDAEYLQGWADRDGPEFVELDE